MALRQDKSQIWDKLDDLWLDEDLETRSLHNRKWVVLSDLHMGDGSRADDLAHNEDIVMGALHHYNESGASLILLGDIEEFWLFDLEHIRARYNPTIYREIRAFGDDRVVRIFGNHDMEWGLRTDPAKNDGRVTAAAAEGLKLTDASGSPRILLVHGHQGSRNADRGSWASRFFVRLFRPVKPVARSTRVYRKRSATRSQIQRDFERARYEWGKKRGVVLICGHSHRAIFASKSYAQRLKDELAQLQATGETPDRRELDRKRRRLLRELEKEKEAERDIDCTDCDEEPLPCYFNAGCALYRDCITCIELDEGEIRLVKWERDEEKEIRRHVFIDGSLDEMLERMEEVSG
jgi:UDP-2,3-diacylglucosamine pyrophosphatase LpxH